MQQARSIKVAAAAGAALMMAACSSSTTAPATTPAAPESSAPASSAPAAPTSAAPTEATETPTAEATTSAEKLPKPPKGSTEKANREVSGGSYARYSNAQLGPAKIVNKYKKKATKAGYTVKSAGGSGGGWGGYGGASAGLVAEKSSGYLDVQAGGSRQGATYFEVCVGKSKSAVGECDHHSDQDQDSDSGGS